MWGGGVGRGTPLTRPLQYGCFLIIHFIFLAYEFYVLLYNFEIKNMKGENSGEGKGKMYFFNG